jgi:lipopolysaccharide export system protein LptA
MFNAHKIRSLNNMGLKPHILRWAAVLGMVLPACLARALPDDQKQPIHVTADSAVQETNTVTYRGNVVIVQGSVRIEADQVVIYHEKGKLQKAIATGKPAHFQEQPEVGGSLITGNAGTLIYYNADQRVELLQNAFVDRDKSSVKGDRIEYLLPSKTVRAESAPSNASNNRVLQPSQPKAADAPAQTLPQTAPASPAVAPPASGKP